MSSGSVVRAPITRRFLFSGVVVYLREVIGIGDEIRSVFLSFRVWDIEV